LQGHSWTRDKLRSVEGSGVLLP